MPAYFKIHRDGKTLVHLAHSAGEDQSICGEDVVGDDSLDDKTPESLGENVRRRVTCPHCLAIIATCRDHLRHNTNTPS